MRDAAYQAYVYKLRTDPNGRLFIVNLGNCSMWAPSLITPGLMFFRPMTNISLR